MTVNIAINGFGRIGRNVFKRGFGMDGLNFVAINDLTDPKTLAHLLKYDSVWGKYEKEVSYDEEGIIVDGQKIRVYSEKDPSKLPWKEHNIHVVMEATGIFRDSAGCKKHLDAGAKKVMISAPAKGSDIATFVFGVNHTDYDPAKDHIVSNASCTTNCLAPVAMVLNNKLKIKSGIMTTIHAYTNDQRILDLPHSDLRRARAAAVSMIPTTTGAASAVGLVLPALKGRLDGMAIRVPTPNVSLVDLTAVVEKDTDENEINNLMNEASGSYLKGILQYCDEPLVSIDFNRSDYSSIFDSLATKVIDKNLVKVLAWYDNEWGYSCRMIDLALYMKSRM